MRKNQKTTATDIAQAIATIMFFGSIIAMFCVIGAYEQSTINGWSFLIGSAITLGAMFVSALVAGLTQEGKPNDSKRTHSN